MKFLFMSKTVDGALAFLLKAAVKLEKLSEWLEAEAVKREEEIRSAQERLAAHRAENARAKNVAGKLKELLN